jgi:hypothetical protein
VSDGVSELLAALDRATDRTRALAVGAGATIVLGIVLVLPGGVSGSLQPPGEQFADWYRAHQNARPLRAPGAGRIRQGGAVAGGLDRVALVTRRNCSTFVALGASYTYYLLAGVDPPTGYNAPLWEQLLTADEQRKIVDEIERRDRVCLLLGPVGGIPAPDGRVVVAPMARRPLVRFIENSRWDVIREVAPIRVLRLRPDSGS